MTRQDAEILLKKQFRLERFYDTQWEVIQKILKGERVLFFVLPTQYNSRHLVPLGVTQTVLLTKRHRCKPQNSRLTPKFSKAT
jgi:hypothetical protein